jgi:hypothetical protein
MNDDENDAAFYEVQYMRHPVLLAVVGIIAALMWISFVQQIIYGVPFGTNPAPDVVMWVFVLLFGVGLPVLIYAARLETVVRDGALMFRYVPFHLAWRVVPCASIVRAKAEDYSPLREFGGWGIRFGWKGRAYSASGNMGVRIECRDGDRFLLGSGRAAELARCIGECMRQEE